MAEDKKPAKPSKARDNPKPITIERDSQFIRIAADDALPIGRKYHLQIAFLSEDRNPTHIERRLEGSSQSGSVGVRRILFEPAMVELARVRLPYPRAFNMAMQVLGAFLESDPTQLARVKAAVLGLIEAYENKTPPVKKRVAK